MEPLLETSSPRPQPLVAGRPATLTCTNRPVANVLRPVAGPLFIRRPPNRHSPHTNNNDNTSPRPLQQVHVPPPTPSIMVRTFFSAFRCTHKFVKKIIRIKNIVHFVFCSAGDYPHWRNFNFFFEGWKCLWRNRPRQFLCPAFYWFYTSTSSYHYSGLFRERV